MTEDVQQPKMRFVDAEKYVSDGIEYTVAYESNGLVTCKSDEPEIVPEPEQPEQPGYISYTMKFSVAKPAHLIKFLKVSPHSKAGKALVKS